MTLSRFPLYFAVSATEWSRWPSLLLFSRRWALAPRAEAHPLGNFSVNHLSTVSISKDRVDVRYVLDQAEIPTVQERGLGRAEVLRRKLDEVRRGLVLTVNGRPTALRQAAPPQLTLPNRRRRTDHHTPRAHPQCCCYEHARRVELEDNTFSGSVGWKAIVSAPGSGTAVRTATPSGDPTDGLRRYPRDLLASPADRRSASFSVRPGDGSLTAPGATRGGRAESRAEGGFAGLFADAASGQGVLLVLLAAAFGWGALHALSPGHGKAMVAAYLIGTRGTRRDAVLLGATVTVTHTIGVFALGFVTLGLSQYVLPEDLYPWLTLVSGLMVVAIGAGVLRSRLRPTHQHSHTHGHSHDHDHPHDHGHTHRGVLSMGAAAGLIPCPSALVVLLAAIAQHEVALGMLLIVAFSLGLAGTLTVLGLAVVHARRFVPPRIAASRAAALMPAASALLVMAVGFVLAARAVPGVV